MAMRAAGRLDPWQSQLRDGARPENMEISSRDVLVLDSGAEAWSTCLESPALSPGGVFVDVLSSLPLGHAGIPAGCLSKPDLDL